MTLSIEEKTEFIEKFKDKEFREEAFRKFTALDDWRPAFDRLNSAALAMMFETLQNELTLDQLAYLINRHGSEARTPCRIQRKPKNQVAVDVYVVYWIVRESDIGFPLYVGQTRDLRGRWNAHRVGSQELVGIKDIKSIRINVVETVCGTLSQALEAECRHIKAARQINPRLMNGTHK